MTDSSFPHLNVGYNRVFQKNRVSIGLVIPIEAYASAAKPTMEQQVRRIQLAEELGFSAVWLRDVPFDVPTFGDVGQIFDPFVYLGLLSASTKKIALGVASIILPLRHPAHIAKSAASIDVLSNGRLILGVASGDRPDEYPAMNQSYAMRAKNFRESLTYIQKMWTKYPKFSNTYGQVHGHIDMLPKPVIGKVPILITGGSQQNSEWLANNGDGWMIYPRELSVQQKIIQKWRHDLHNMRRADLPVMQPLYIDLEKDVNASMRAVHLGFRTGIKPLKEYIRSLQKIGINHVALNLRFNQRPIEQTLHELAQELL